MSGAIKHGERYTITLSEFEQRVVEEIVRDKKIPAKKVIKASIRAFALAHKTGLGAYAEEVA